MWVAHTCGLAKVWQALYNWHVKLILYKTTHHNVHSYLSAVTCRTNWFRACTPEHKAWLASVNWYGIVMTVSKSRQGVWHLGWTTFGCGWLLIQMHLARPYCGSDSMLAVASYAVPSCFHLQLGNPAVDPLPYGPYADWTSLPIAIR